MEKGSAILVTGSSGLLGNSLVNRLIRKGYKRLLTPSLKELDLMNQEQVDKYFRNNKIDYVFHLAAKVGGFGVKTSASAEFLYDNLLISCNVIEASRKYNIKRMIFIGSACIYSLESGQPFKENTFSLGKLDSVNESYGLSKIAGLKLCEYYNKQYKTNFIGLVPCNLYGPNDTFGPSSHIIPRFIMKFHDAKKNNLPFVQIEISSKVRREFLFVDDLADAMTYFIEYPDITRLEPFVNIGYGKDVSVKDLALAIKQIVGYSGKIKFNETQQGSMPKRLLDIKKAISLGWAPKTALKDGIKKTYDWFLKNKG